MRRSSSKSLCVIALRSAPSLTAILVALAAWVPMAAAGWDPLFRTAQYFANGSGNSTSRFGSPYGLAVADFDVDGKPDVAVGLMTGGVQVHMHALDPRNFQMFPPLYGSFGTSPALLDLAAADFDLDGKPDLLTGRGNDVSSAEIVLALKTNLGFTIHKTYGVPGVRKIAAADVNYDGRPDAVIGGFIGPATEVGLKVMLSVSADSLAPAAAYYAGPSDDWATDPRAMTVADATGDGLLDVVMSVNTIGSPGALYIFQGTVAGTFPTLIGPIETASVAEGIVVAHLNEDAIPDLAVTSPAQNAIVVRFGSGNGVFQAPTLLPAAITPSALCAGDVDMDGFTDLVAVTSDPANIFKSVAVVRGLGAGAFSASAIYAGLPGAGEAALVDTDLDGRLDLVAAMFGGGTNARTHAMGMLLNDGTGAFRGGKPGVELTFPSAEVVGDFNRDGIPDLAAASSSEFTVAFGLGDGTFGTPTWFALGTNAHKLFAVDMDLNGSLDIVAASSTGNTMYLNSGTGTFTPGFMPITTPAVAVYDMNRDALPDLLVEAGGTMTPWINTSIPGLGGMIFSFEARPPIAPTTGVNGVAIGDWNRDGFLDVAVAGAGGVATFLGLPNGTFAAQGTVATDRGYSALCTADLNRDGIPDLAARENLVGVATLVPGPRGLDVFMGAGNGTFTRTNSLGTQELTGWNLVAVDANRDGWPDLVTSGSTDATGGAPYALSADLILNSGGADFAMRVGYSLGTIPPGISPGRRFEFADVDRNGATDILPPVAGGNTGTAIHSVLATPPARGHALKSANFYLAINNPSSVAVGDLNRDGKLDVVAGAFGTSPGVAVLLGGGNGSLGPATTLAQSWNSNRVRLADFNRDGILDIATSNPGFGAPRVATMLGVGDGTFGPRLDTFILAGLDFEVGDWNRDGIPDVVTSAEDSIRVLHGTGTGTFTVGPSCALPSAPIYDIELADLNRDGRLDVAIAGGNLKVVYGNSSGGFDPPSTLAAPLTFCQTLCVADLNRDGYLDIVANSSGTFYVLWGAATAAYSTFATTALPFGAFDIQVGEAAADGVPYIYVSRNLENLEVLSVSQAGALSVVGSYFIANTPSELALGDLDRNGCLDVVSIGNGGSFVSVNLHGFGIVTAVEGAQGAPPAAPRVTLGQNFPNPFNPRTTIRYALPRAERVRLSVYDVRGRLVRTLRDGFEPAGERRVEWDGMNGRGQAVASGVYLYRLSTESGESESKRMVVVK